MSKKTKPISTTLLPTDFKMPVRGHEVPGRRYSVDHVKGNDEIDIEGVGEFTRKRGDKKAKWLLEGNAVDGGTADALDWIANFREADLAALAKSKEPKKSTEPKKKEPKKSGSDDS